MRHKLLTVMSKKIVFTEMVACSSADGCSFGGTYALN